MFFLALSGSIQLFIRLQLPKNRLEYIKSNFKGAVYFSKRFGWHNSVFYEQFLGILVHVGHFVNRLGHLDNALLQVMIKFEVGKDGEAELKAAYRISAPY